MGCLKTCKDASRMTSATQESSSSEILEGQGDDFPTGIESWSIRSPGLLRGFSVTGAALRIPFSWPGSTLERGWKNCKTHCYKAVSFAFNFPFLTEVSQNCVGIDIANLEN